MKRLFSSIKVGFFKGNYISSLSSKLILVNNSNLLRIFKLIGSICVLLVLLNKHILLYFYITNFILIISVVHLLYIFVVALIKFIKGIRAILSTEGLFILVNNIITLAGASIILNKIYANNNYLINNVYLLFNLFLILSILLIVFITLNSSKNKIIKNVNKVFTILAIFIGKTLLSPIILLEGTDNSNTNNESNNTNNESTNNDNESTNTNNGKTNEYHAHTHIHAENIVKEGVSVIGKAINSGLGQAASQIGLAGSISAGMATGASVSVGQPPITRLGISLAGGAGAGAIHVVASSANRALNHSTSNDHTNLSADSTPSSPKEGFINSPNEEISIINLLKDNPIELWLGGLIVMNIVNLIFILFLLLAVISKIILSLNYQLNWIDKILPSGQSLKVKSFLLSTIKFFARLREYNIIMIIIVLIINSLFIIYYFSLYFFNLEEMCKLYLELKKK